LQPLPLNRKRPIKYDGPIKLDQKEWEAKHIITRKKVDPKLTTKLVLELLKEEKTVSQLASEHGIHHSRTHSLERSSG
jgi:hypothetical protein